MDVRRVVAGTDDGGVTTVRFDGPSPHVYTLPGYPPSPEPATLVAVATATPAAR